MSFNKATTARVINPFWVRRDEKNPYQDFYRIAFRGAKILLYLFLAGMGLYGCIQPFFDTSVSQSPTLGQGNEIVFNFGITGDSRYDAQSYLGIGGEGYNVFSNFTMKYGPFYAFFVWPASQLVMAIMWSTSGLPAGLNTVLAIIILLLIIRCITLALSMKSTLQGERMGEIQQKVAEVNVKYKGMTDATSKQRKQMEIMAIYKKNKFNALAPLENIFVVGPIFLIIFRIVSSTRPIKATILFNIWDLSKTSVSMIFSNLSNGGAWYILFLALLIPAQIMQTKLPQILSKRRNKNMGQMTQQTKEEYRKKMMTQWIVYIVIIAMTSLSATGVGLYYIFNSLAGMAQSYGVHRYILYTRAKKKPKLEDIKIELDTTAKKK